MGQASQWSEGTASRSHGNPDAISFAPKYRVSFVDRLATVAGSLPGLLRFAEACALRVQAMDDPENLSSTQDLHASSEDSQDPSRFSIPRKSGVTTF